VTSIIARARIADGHMTEAIAEKLAGSQVPPIDLFGELANEVERLLSENKKLQNRLTASVKAAVGSTNEADMTEAVIEVCQLGMDLGFFFGLVAGMLAACVVLFLTACR